MPNVSWYKPGDVMPSAEGVGAAEIQFVAVNREQAGNYTCKAENVAGIVKSIVKIIVYCKRTIYQFVAL